MQIENAPTKEIMVLFKLKEAKTLMGEYVSVVGDSKALGNWNNQKCHHLKTF